MFLFLWRFGGLRCVNESGAEYPLFLSAVSYSVYIYIYIRLYTPFIYQAPEKLVEHYRCICAAHHHGKNELWLVSKEHSHTIFDIGQARSHNEANEAVASPKISKKNLPQMKNS